MSYDFKICGTAEKKKMEQDPDVTGRSLKAYFYVVLLMTMMTMMMIIIITIIFKEMYFFLQKFGGK
jgi:hypothetical protein